MNKYSHFNVKDIRNDFPNLNVKVHEKSLVYLDNAATTFKPQVVIDSINKYYAKYTSNVHRGVHSLSEQATTAYEDTRNTVKKFLNASSEKEIIFTKGTTDSINLVAHSFGKEFVHEGDEIIITEMEHHSNIVPWQILCEENGAQLKILPMNDNGELCIDQLDDLISNNTKLISVVYVSNSLGTINPVKEIIDQAHKHDIKVMIDAAQAVSFTPIDVQDLDCDFLAFSSHKLFGPTGVGILYGKQALLDQMPPYQGGGDMISSVTFEKTIYNDLPYKFEAGTPNIADVIGLGTAIDYFQELNFESMQLYKKDLLIYGTEALQKVNGIKIIGQAKNKTSVLSFIVEGVHAHDLGTLLDQEGVAVRTGHHCTQPVMDHFNITATSRASLAMYNTKEEIDHLVIALNKAISLFK